MNYCTDCIHYKVCGNEGVDDSAMTFCADKQTDKDLISRKDLLKELEKWDWQDTYLPIHFAELVADLPSAEKTAEETNLTSEELFDLDIEQNVKDIDSGEDDSYYRGRLAGMLSAYRILKGKPYEEKETEVTK